MQELSIALLYTVNKYFKLRLILPSERSCYTFNILTFLVGVIKYIAFICGTGSRFLCMSSTTTKKEILHFYD